MGFIFLLIAAFASSVKAYSSKRISSEVGTVSDNIHVTMVRMLICASIGAVGVVFAAGNEAFVPLPEEILIFGISGLSLTVFVMSWLFAVKTGAFLLVNAFSAASFVIPGVTGLFLLQEQFTVYKFAAVICIGVALYFLLKYNTHIKGHITGKKAIVLGLVWLSQGVNQSTQKFYVQYAPEKSVMVYNFYTFTFAALFLIVFWVLTGRRQTKRNKMKPYVYGFIAVMAAALFLNTYFLTLAAARLDAIVLYPLSSALGLVINSIMAHVCFGEQLKRDSIIGIVFTLAALLLSQK